METFTELKNFVGNPCYHEHRQECLRLLDINKIDRPIAELIRGLTTLPYCFPLQSCYGHFLYEGQGYPCNIKPLPNFETIETVEYRIAYVTLCLENNEFGVELFHDLLQISSLDPMFIQFGCAEWFWNTQDVIPFDEALHLEKIRNLFFANLHTLLRKHLKIKKEKPS